MSTFLQGEWKPKQIDNPNYKGKWVHPEIDNPEYVQDDKLGSYPDFGAIGFDLWQVGLLFMCGLCIIKLNNTESNVTFVFPKIIVWLNTLSCGC